jgi:hypothetical protein
VDDPEAAAGLRYLVGRNSSTLGAWVKEHPDLVDATLTWWRKAAQNGGFPPADLVRSWRALSRRCWAAQVDRLLAQRQAIAVSDPHLRPLTATLANGGLVADHELVRERPTDGREAADEAMAEHETRREAAVTANIQALPLHRRLVVNRADLDADYDARHLCVCPRCGVPQNDDEDPAASHHDGARCRCCGDSVVPMIEYPELPPPLEDSLDRIASRRERLGGGR